MQQSISSYFFPRIGIDLGSHMLRICTDAQALVVSTQTCVALHTSNSAVMAYGAEAAEMQGKIGTWVDVQWPVQNGVISDPHIVAKLLQHVLHSERLLHLFSSPTGLVSVPVASTSVQREVVADVLRGIGFREVLTIAQPLAASIGAGVPIADASGSLLIHVGNERIEAALIALGSVVTSDTGYKAGRFLKDSVQEVLREQFSLAISHAALEAIITHGVSVAEGFKKKIRVQGKDLATGKPTALDISSTVFQPIAFEVVTACEHAITTVLKDVPPELTADIMQKGVLLSGGAARLHGLAQAVGDRLRLPIALVEEPELVVSKGLHTTLQYVGEFRESIGYVS